MLLNFQSAGVRTPAGKLSAVSFAVALCSFASFSAAADVPGDKQGAEKATHVLSETVVAATRTAQPVTDLVADVSIVDREQIDRSGAVSLEDVLVRLPGVEITRNGGPGTTTSVYLRGSNNEFTAVYIDGIRLDVQSGSGGAPWEAMPLNLVDRIEVLRGPAGAIYGSDAVGGAIQIFTRKGEQGLQPYVQIGAGSQGTAQASAGLSGGVGAWDYALSAAYGRSDGFNSRTRPSDNADKDGYIRKSANARVGLQINAAHRLDATLLRSESKSQFDNTQDDDLNFNQLQALGLTWKAQWSEHYASQLAVSESHSEYETQPSPYQAKTTLRNILFQNEWRQGGHTVTAALERREDGFRGSALNGAQYDRFQNAIGLGWGLRSGPHTVQLNARHDHDSEFGGKTTGSAAYGFALTPQWRVNASVGTAFRVPTLYQRFSEYGDDSLKPQESRNVELGLRWAEGDSLFSVTAYRNTISHLINYIGGPGGCPSSWGCYENVDKAVYEGLTFAGAYRLGAVRLSGSIDFQNPRDQSTGKRLARRAARHATVMAETRLAGWDWGVQMQSHARRFDNSSSSLVLGGFTLWNLSASRSLGRDFTVFARLDNLTDKQYQWANTYATPGRTAYVGVKWAPH